MFSLFQQFYECIVNAEISKENLDVLQLGFYLLTHEHLSVWEHYTHANESNLVDMLNYGIDATIDLLDTNFLCDDADTYVVLYKDSLEGIVNLVKKYNTEKDNIFSTKCNNLKPSNRSIQNSRDLNLFLDAFKEKFKEAAEQICCNIEQVRSVEVLRLNRYAETYYNMMKMFNFPYRGFPCQKKSLSNLCNVL